MALDYQGYEEYDENAFPLAYLITFRTYGTWLHGDTRGSFQRHRDRETGKYVRPSAQLKLTMERAMKQKPVTLNAIQRLCVHQAIVEVCTVRQYLLRALNVRSNHGHVVISSRARPEKITNDLKAYATRRLRDEAEIDSSNRVWARGSSTRYLWKAPDVISAIDYVLYSQGNIPFELVSNAHQDG